ncbi:hypothetical protein D3C75_429640 [compost metagenome]
MMAVRQEDQRLALPDLIPAFFFAHIQASAANVQQIEYVDMLTVQMPVARRELMGSAGDIEGKRRGCQVQDHYGSTP